MSLLLQVSFTRDIKLLCLCKSENIDQSRDKDESDTLNSNQLSYSRTLTNGPDNKDSKFCMFDSA